MKYAKLINNTISYAPRKIRQNGRWYFNANENIMRAEGWLPVIFTEPPEVPEGYMLQEYFTIFDGQIIQNWAVVEIPGTPTED